MTQTNRVQVAIVRETTFGTTPVTPRMRLARFNSGDPMFKPTYVDPDEIRSDRMLNDPIQVMTEADATVAFDFYYPADNDPLSEMLRSAMYSAWVNTPTFFNDQTADSVVTDVGTVANTYAVISGGAAVVAGQLVRATGFANSANNQVFKVASSSATTIVGTALGLVAEAIPPATAKLKVVGFQGASADITATASGLGSTALNFTTLGLAVGMWVKIGGTAAGEKFVTAALNDYARIIGITATALTLDNLPSGWAVDNGAGKTIKVWFGDYIKNGITKTGLSLEFGYLGQAVPTYVLCKGQIPNTANLTITSRQKITGSISFSGMAGVQSTVAQSGTPDTRSTAVVMAANANVGRMSEGGSKLTLPSPCHDFSIQIANNTRKIESVDSAAPLDILDGQFGVTGRVSAYFGDNVLYAKLLSGAPTMLSSIIAKNGQAFIVDIPRVTYRGGSPNITGKNADVILPLDYAASIDTTYTQAALLFNRLEYIES